MAISDDLLKILVCPETKQKLSLADGQLVEQLNRQIVGGKLTNRGGEQLKQPLSGALLREDGKYFYPVRDDIPIMLIEEAVAIQNSSKQGETDKQ